jgi:hypothetical protein
MDLVCYIHNSSSLRARALVPGPCIAIGGFGRRAERISLIHRLDGFGPVPKRIVICALIYNVDGELTRTISQRNHASLASPFRRYRLCGRLTGLRSTQGPSLKR